MRASTQRRLRSPAKILPGSALSISTATSVDAHLESVEVHLGACVRTSAAMNAASLLCIKAAWNAPLVLASAP